MVVNHFWPLSGYIECRKAMCYESLAVNPDGDVAITVRRASNHSGLGLSTV